MKSLYPTSQKVPKLVPQKKPPHHSELDSHIPGKRGIRKIRKALQGVGLPDPVFEENCGGVRVTILRPRNIANLGAVNGGDFGDDFGDEKQVCTVILASPEISQPQIAKITCISVVQEARRQNFIETKKNVYLQTTMPESFKNDFLCVLNLHIFLS